MTRSSPTAAEAISTEAQERIERALGPAFLDLPWSSPEHADAQLDEEGRRRVGALNRRLDESWRTEEPWFEVVGALSDLFPDDFVASYAGRFADGTPVGMLSQDAAGRPTMSPPPFVSLEGLRRGRKYGAGPTAFANRPASLAALCALDGSLEEGLATFRTIFPTQEVGNQLRSAITQSIAGRPALVCYVGVLRPTRRGFSLAEHRRLYAAQRAVARWYRHSRALGRAPLRSSGLPVAMLDAFEEPAFVLSGQRVVHANRAGRSAAFPVDVGHLRSLAISQQPFSADGGRDYELLVLPRAMSRVALDTLSPGLREVASLLAQGLSDKEIAVASKRPVSTVRTYVKRVFRRLGVHSRRDLMQRYGDMDRPEPLGAASREPATR